MRTTDERLAAAKRRAEEIKRQERSRRSRIAAVSGAAACLAAILGLALAMPSVTEMVQNSLGVPPADVTPFLTACA